MCVNPSPQHIEGFGPVEHNKRDPQRCMQRQVSYFAVGANVGDVEDTNTVMDMDMDTVNAEWVNSITRDFPTACARHCNPPP